MNMCVKNYHHIPNSIRVMSIFADHEWMDGLKLIIGYTLKIDPSPSVDFFAGRARKFFHFQKKKKNDDFELQ